ncbi:MAG TPA: hypothetical protein VGG20_04645 [Thermoanaerobaculia bacterium]|jgi:hypothetical protein
MNSKHQLAAFGVVFALLIAPPAVKAEEAKDNLVTVTTKDYVLTAHTPEGWTGDTEGAKQYQGVVIFAPKAAGPDGVKVLVSVHHKSDENTELRLQGEISQYRKRYPHLVLTDLDVKHPQYATFGKLFSQPDDFYQYISFLNPGTVYPYTLYVAMLKQKTPATPEDLAAYRDILQSLKIALVTPKPAP